MDSEGGGQQSPPPNLPTSGEEPWRLGQDLLALLEVPDGLRAYFQDALLEALPQDAGAGGGGVQARDEHEVGARVIELQRLRNVVGGQHDAHARRVRADAAQQPQVARATQDVVGDARDDELCVFDACVVQRVHVRDVAVDDLDAPSPQLAHDG